MESAEMSMEEKIVEELKSILGDLGEVWIQREKRVYAKVPKNLVLPILAYLKDKGFHQLTTITCVDWIKRGKFELIYNLFSLYHENIHVFIKTELERDKETMPTAIDIYPMAFDYEREIHEMFGIVFEGHPRLDSFILEDWDGPPPMRKDFDTAKYVEEKYGVKDYTEEIWKRMEQPYREEKDE
uniref:NADH-quinone oxidoreductase subunit C n=1 Tax=candidate division WOR-3 bacterium TaxID=2052148 RepID=A0A7V3ZXA2_UNCW3